MDLILEPVLAVDETLDDEGSDIVACGVQHGGGRIDQVAQGDGDGVGNGHLVGEEDGAQNQFAGAAAAGNAGHGNGGEDRHDDGQDGLTGAEVLAEDAEEESNLDDGGHGGAVHVHGGAQGQDDVGDILADAGLLGGLHVGGDGGDGGAGAEGNGSGLEEVLEHDLHSALAAAEAGVDGEEGEHVGEAQDIVDDQGAGVVADQLGAVVSNQVGEEAEEADGGVVGDDLDHIHNAAGHILQQLGGHGLLAAGHLDAEAEEDGEDDQGQDGPAGPQLHEVGLGEEVDDHVGQAQRLADLTLGDGVLALNQGEDAADHIHDDGGDACGGAEGGHGGAHDLAGLLHGLHVGDGGADGAEDHRHDHAEHQVGEDGAEPCQAAGLLGEQPAEDAAGGDTGQHAGDKAIVFQEIFHFRFTSVGIECPITGLLYSATLANKMQYVLYLLQKVLFRANVP